MNGSHIKVIDTASESKVAMDSQIIILVVFAILARGHFGHEVKNWNEEDGNHQPSPGHGVIIHRDDLKNLNKALLHFEQTARDTVKNGLRTIFGFMRSLMCKSRSGDRHPTDADLPSFRANKENVCKKFDETSQAIWGGILKVQPDAKEAEIKKGMKIHSDKLVNSYQGIYSAMKLAYKQNASEVLCEIDRLEPPSVKLIANAIGRFYITMREATPGEPIILATHKASQRTSMIHAHNAASQIFVGIRCYLDWVFFGSNEDGIEKYLIRLRKALRDAVTQIWLHITTVFREMRRYAKCPYRKM